eukprot:313157-Pelagomonas_calceolata.AAC.5
MATHYSAVVHCMAMMSSRWKGNFMSGLASFLSGCKQGNSIEGLDKVAQRVPSQNYTCPP